MTVRIGYGNVGTAAAIVPHNAVADSLTEISRFAEESTEAEILDGIREIGQKKSLKNKKHERTREK